MSILERLYMGNLCPYEESIPHNVDYRSLSIKIGEEREYFEGILSAEEKERFKAWNEMMFRYEDITSYEKFKHGFSLGIMLASEIFAEREIN